MPDPIGPNMARSLQPIGPPNASSNNIKKKDPYATAWRTYSKIAEELDLLNPDGSLYPISKEAILKYLRHQSKRIKSSNLHWYVNGLKKHQENLGFPWDDIRYDDQVVALLKELTLHPATIVHAGISNSNSINNGAINGSNRSVANDSAPIAYGQLSERDHQGSGIESRQLNSHYYDESAKITGLTITHPKIKPPSQPYPGSYGVSEPYTQRSSPNEHNYEKPPSSVQMKHSYSQQPHQIHAPSTAKATSYHSAPIKLSSSSGNEPQQPRVNEEQHQLSIVSPTSQQSSPMSSSELHFGNASLSTGTQAGSSRSQDSHMKQTEHLTSPNSQGDDMEEDSELLSKPISHDNQDNRQSERMEEETSDHITLKRFASTGTLRNQSRSSSISVHPYPRPIDHRQRDDQSTTLSPRVRENDPSGGSIFFPIGSPESTTLQSRVSPLGSAASIGSNSPASRNTNVGGPIPSTPRHKRTNGVVSSPIFVASVHASTANVSSSSVNSSTNKQQTVQFSEVAEVAQRLQSKYGNRCTSHPWGCVELSEEFHLELTIKMYMDWAGLVASGRLTMDELPDLPEFRVSGDGSTLSSSSPPITFIGGGTLKRMSSTPPTITMGSFSQSSTNMKSEELSPSPDRHTSPRGHRVSSYSSGAAHGGVKKHRSPSRSPIYGSSPKDGYLIESLMSRIGSPPPTSFLPSLPTMSFSNTAKESIIRGESSPRQRTPSAGDVLANSSVTKTRARRMASSPSLGQHQPSSTTSPNATPPARLSRGNSYGMIGPPLPTRPEFMPPMPPVPPLPSLFSQRLATGKLLNKRRNEQGDRRDAEAKNFSISSPVISSSPLLSENMDLSSNEDEGDDDTLMVDDNDTEKRNLEDGSGTRTEGSQLSTDAAISSLHQSMNRDLVRRRGNSLIGQYSYKSDEDLEMINGRSETSHQDNEMEENEGRGKNDDAEYNERIDKSNRRIYESSDQSPNNNNRNGGEVRNSNLHWSEHQQSNSGDEKGPSYHDSLHSQSHNNKLDSNEYMEQESEEDEESASDMHISATYQPNRQHKQVNLTIISTQHHYSNETSHDTRQDHENKQYSINTSEVDEQEDTMNDGDNNGTEKSGHFSQQRLSHHHHNYQHPSYHHQNRSNDSDEDKVEEVRMEFKSLHSLSS
ncbi:hypothetical protein FBU30_010939 [Linnemannia zychae]|nr:hypothetical protein FBU30_010939 [Linnemannia zychae]